MPLKVIDLHHPLPPIQWLIPGLIPRGYLSLVGSLPGEGKTALLTALAWQLSRPFGEFVGHDVERCSSVYLDFDAPAEGRGLRYWLERHANSYPDGGLELIHVLEPDPNTYGLGEGELQELQAVVRQSGAGVVILDSFMAAFPSVDPIKLHQVQGPLWYLRRLAQELEIAVILIDHLPKPVLGEKAGARGVMGSIAKPAQARAVHILSRIPPREIQGRHVLRWECTKMSYGKLPEPFGVELVFSENSLEVIPSELPSEYADTRTEKAKRAVQDYLETHPNQVVQHAELLDIAIREGNLGRTRAKEALKTAVEDLGESVAKIQLSGRGNPVAYRLNPADPVTQIEETLLSTATI